MKFSPFKITVLYLVIGMAWIIGSDHLLFWIKQDLSAAELRNLQSFKGIIFILLSGSLLFLMINRLHQSLLRSEKIYKRLFEENPVPMYIFDINTFSFLAVNEAMIKKYGYTKEEFFSMTIKDIRPQEEVARLTTELGQLGDTQISDNGIWLHMGQNKTPFYVAITTHLTRYNGRKARLVMAQDVDELVRSEQRVKEANERYEMVARATNDAIWDWNLKTNEMFWNHGFFNIFGYQPDTILFRSEWSFNNIHPDDRQKITEGLQKTIQNRQHNWSDEYRYKCANGNYKYVYDRGYIIFDTKDVPVRMIGAMQDIDQRKKNEEEIRMLSIAVSKSSNAILITNAKNEIEWVNEGFTAMTGYSLSEIRGLQPRSFLHGEDTDQQTIRKIDEQLMAKKPFSAEIMNHKKDGTPYWVKMDISPILNKVGEPERFVSILTDITERKKFVLQLQEQNKRLRDIAWINSHGIRRPLSNILGLIYLFQRHQDDKEYYNELVLLLQQSAKELDQIVRQVEANAKEISQAENLKPLS